MPNVLESLAGRWIARRAHPDPAALAAVAGLAPALVVTGGSRGFGLALARAFSSGDHGIVLVARTAAALEAARATFPGAMQSRLFVLALDVTAADAAARLEREIDARGLYADVLVNCAGTGLAGPFAEEDAARLAATIELNITALTQLTHTFLPAMLARGRGGIVNVASLGGFVPGPHQALYYASKAYVLSLTEAIAAENAGAGVRIMAVAPGPLETGFHAAMGAGAAAYRWLPGADPGRIARLAWRSYRLGRRVTAPGILATAAAWVLKVVPHPVSLPIVKALLYVPKARRRTPRPGRLDY